MDKQIVSDAYHDDLTGLRNLKSLYSSYHDADLTDYHFIYVDIDDYNRMTMVFGVDIIEEMLVTISETLVEFCGKTDVFRVGNDQFLLVTKNKYYCEPEELQTMLKYKHTHNEMKLVINVSITAAHYADFKGDSLEDIHKLLHLITDLSKADGRNTLIYANQKHKEHYLKMKEIEDNISEGVKNKDFYPVYRPYVDTFNSEIIGFEAVSRWRLNGKILKPSSFLEIANWTGLISKIDMDIFKKGLEFFKHLKENDSINLSSRFKAGFNFSEHTLMNLDIDKIIDMLKQHDIAAKNIIIEIHELSVLDKKIRQQVENLYELGFLIILDEYSNDTSSLTHLSDFTVDVLKLSETLLQDVNDSEEFKQKMHIYEFLVDIAKKFDLGVIAAGLKTKKDLKLVRQLGVEIAQGKFFKKPVDEEEFSNFIKHNKKTRIRV
ncbi:MAG: GGDEF domain-containing protein [Candidatus Izimaplasma sp.]|nr:GGDEF domain-containing protein [Candidatus Izimaplasma bacterium]